MKRIEQDIKTGQFNRLYLLCGDDEYFLKVYKNKLKKALVSEDDGGMNFTEFSGKGLSENEIMDTARTFPFLAERRVVIVSDSGFFAAKDKKSKDTDDDDESDDTLVDEKEEASADTGSKKKKGKSVEEYGLKEFFAEIPETTVLIFCEEKVNRNLKTFKEAQKYGYVATFNRIKEDDYNGIERIRGYVANILSRNKMNMTNGAWKTLIDRTGTDLRVVFNELEKLICHSLEKGVIEEDDVKALIPEKIEDRVFDMIDCITAHQQNRALDMYYDILRTKSSKPVAILSLIETRYRQMHSVKKLSADGITPKDMGAMIGGKKPLTEWACKKLLSASQKYTYEDLKRASQMCLDYDKAFRSGKMKDNIAVEMVIVAMSSREKVVE